MSLAERQHLPAVKASVVYSISSLAEGNGGGQVHGGAPCSIDGAVGPCTPYRTCLSRGSEEEVCP